MKNGKSLRDFDSMSSPHLSSLNDFENRLLVDELNYDKEELASMLYSMLPQLTEEQKHVYDEIMNSVLSN